MMTTILSSVAVALALFLGYVSTRSGKFRYERSGLINASPETIFPYISQFKLGSSWSPYELRDPAMVKSITGTDGTVGAVMTFKAKPSVGAGQLEILKVVPNELVEMRLDMTKPVMASNTIEYKLMKEGNATRFSWVMRGDDSPFIGKLMATLIDCEKMMGKDMSEGIENLKKIIEKN